MLKAIYRRMRTALREPEVYHRAMAGLTQRLLLRPAVVDAIIGRAQRTPYEHIDDYMQRFWLVPPSRWTFGVGVRLQQLLRSDNDRAMHTHPWLWNVSLILRGMVWEITPADKDDPGAHFGGYVNLDEHFRMKQRRPGDLVFRGRLTRHKLMLFRGPVWTLFITGPETGKGWGYWVPGTGLVDRHDYEKRDEE